MIDRLRPVDKRNPRNSTSGDSFYVWHSKLESENQFVWKSVITQTSFTWQATESQQI